MTLQEIAESLGYAWEDVRSMAVEPGLVIVITTDEERHEHQGNYHASKEE